MTDEPKTELVVEQLLSTESTPADPVPPVVAVEPVPEPSPEPEPVKKDVLIPPTVGRIVWFRVWGEDEAINPRAGIIVDVHGDRDITVTVFSAGGGVIEGRNHVVLWHDGDDPLEIGTPYVYWMPYQTSQAKKYA